MNIRENVHKLLAELPGGVELVAAAKTMTPGAVLQAVDAGVKIVGENYVQEAESAYETVGKRARWHFIGHLQKNKVGKAVSIFDMVETVDSLEIAVEIDKRCRQLGKVMQVLVEINSGRETQKAGVLPEDAESLIRKMAAMPNLKVMGLMTMGPFSDNPEDSRPYYAETRKIYERVKSLGISNVDMRYLSMGMSGSYRVALAEGANMVRIGTGIFGRR